MEHAPKYPAATPPAPAAAPATWSRQDWTVYQTANPQGPCVRVLASYATDEEGDALAARLLDLLNAADSPAPSAVPVAGGGEAHRKAASHLLSGRLGEPFYAASGENSGQGGYDADDVTTLVADLLAENARLSARLSEEQQAAAEQEVQKLELVKEAQKLKAAIEKASGRHLSADEREAYASNTNGQGTRGAFGAGEIMGRVALAQDLLALFAPPASPLGKSEEGRGTLAGCQSARDGDCYHKDCPQLRDGEPAKSGRNCPAYNPEDDERD